MDLQNANNLYEIRGICISDASEKLGYGISDLEQVGVALGFAAHLVVILAKYLHIPLRYPIIPMSSRSVIFDAITQFRHAEGIQ
jgi:hypothetical protein